MKSLAKYAFAAMAISIGMTAATIFAYADTASTKTISYSATKKDTVNSTDVVVSGKKEEIAAPTRYTYTPVNTAMTDPSSRFGSGRLTVLANHDSGAQNLSAIMETDGGMIVIDGGWGENGDSLYQTLKTKGGHIGAWLITHPHSDHALALADVLNKHANDLTIDGIYYSFLDEDWYAQNDSESIEVLSVLKPALAKLPESKLHGDIKAGQIIPVGSAQIQVINEPFRITSNAGNNSGVCYTVSQNGSNVVFLGDFGLAAGAKLMECIDLKTLNCDLCQVAHHGQEAVSYSFYQQLAPKGFIWATPQWLWDNDNGSGPGSGKWTTGTTRKWQSGLLINETFCTKDGDVVIE